MYLEEKLKVHRLSTHCTIRVQIIQWYNTTNNKNNKNNLKRLQDRQNEHFMTLH